MAETCPHDVLQLEPSAFAELAGYERPDAAKRRAAMTKSGRVAKKDETLDLKSKAEVESQTFPGPLALPHDDLNYEPDWPAQSFRAWLNEKARNKILTRRKVLYVAEVPKIDRSVEFMMDWTKPKVELSAEDNRPRKKARKAEKVGLTPPNAEEVVRYLEVFYHGMEVRSLPTQLSWVHWKEYGKAKASSSQPTAIPKYVALSYGDRATRIRSRPCPDGVFAAQLNLDDILDAAIAMLPADAYAILLLVDHDIYEDVNDDFCCGRAYGGSRIAVVQSARYNPLLDGKHAIGHSHTWPMSHCKAYVDGLCAVEDVESQPVSTSQLRLSKNGPIRAAVNAASKLPAPISIPELSELWYSRVVRTASHELGHCFGMDHCVYYACNLQGAGGMKEDARQPPYLCPICEAKVGWAIVRELQGGEEADRDKWVKERMKSFDKYCAKKSNVGMWVGLRAWTKTRLEITEDDN